MNKAAEERNPLIDQIVAVIDENFISVNNLRDCDDLITTQDLIQAVNEFILSGGFEFPELITALTDFGFKFTATHAGALQFVWLMKRK